MLLQLQLKSSVLFLDIKAVSGKGVLDRLFKCFVRPDLNYRLKGSGQIASRHDEGLA